MTARTGCREVERLMLAGEDRKLSPEERRLVEGHLHECGRCRGFAADRAVIREESAAILWPRLPGEVDRRTRRAVREGGPAARTLPVPAWVLVALSVVTIITGIWLAVSLADVGPDTRLADLPVAGLAAVLIIVQNALTLLLAPVVLRTVRARREAPWGA